MPLKSKAQMRFFFAAEKEGKLPEGTALKWARESKEDGIDLKKLPERKKVANLLWETFQKVATIGTNTSTAFSGIKNAKPKPGRLNVPKRMVVGTARGFDPRASIKDGLKNTDNN